MGLPKIDVPLYDLFLPLSKKNIKYRPFLVKEEKILLMAMESKDMKSVNDAIKQIVSNCIQGDIEVDDLPVVEFELIFLHIRSRSVGEIVDLQYKCNNEVEGGKCGHIVEMSLDLLTVKPTSPDSDPKITLSGDVGIVLKYPTVKSLEVTSEDDATAFIDILFRNYEYIYDEDSIYYSKDISREEFEGFVEGISGSSFKKIKEFFASLPKLRTELEFKCAKCGYSNKIPLEGIQSFF
jgi:hypothetical protein